MTETHSVGMHLDARGVRAREALSALSAALEDAHVAEPDETGTFEIAVDAPTFDAALQRVFDAVAAAGVDDHVMFLEHPDVPEHWRRRQHDRTSQSPPSDSNR